MRRGPFSARTAGTVILLVGICSSSWTERRTYDGLQPVVVGLKPDLRHPSRSVDSGSKRNVVLRTLLRVSNLLHELIEMLRRVHEVDLVRVHHQQRRLVVPVKALGEPLAAPVPIF